MGRKSGRSFSDQDCIFCKIVKGDVPSYMVYEDELFLGFLDISQFVEGHTIVIPKKHFEVIWDVPYVDEYFKVVQKIGNHYRDLGFNYVDTLTFGRLVLHAHVHIVPHNDDNLDWKKALNVIGEFQRDKSRWPDPENGKRIAERFSLLRR
ncbi:HIT domain-containing protein [Candidatus Dojkabacteria bacterium]|nr:HIT domain-containing protein [Candidatus Dojkabacteria bacterium]